MDAYQTQDCSSGGTDTTSQAVRVANIAEPQYSATFRDGAGALVTPSVTPGSTSTFRLRITRTSGLVNVQSAFVVLPACLTAISAPTMISGGGNNAGWTAELIDNALRLNDGTSLTATNQFVTVQFSATASCSSATYGVQSAAANGQTGAGGAIATVINTAAHPTLVVAAANSPTDIALSASTVAENQPAGTAVGSLSTTDPDAGNTFTYTLVAGIGSTTTTAPSRSLWQCCKTDAHRSTSRAKRATTTSVSARPIKKAEYTEESVHDQRHQRQRSADRHGPCRKERR